MDSEKPKAGDVRDGSPDVESGSQLKFENGEHKLVRQLKNRHIAMIRRHWYGIVSSTQASLSNFPILQLIPVQPIRFGKADQLVFCSDIWPSISLGEMIAYLPIPGGHIKLAERFVSIAGVASIFHVCGSRILLYHGWNYWYNWIVVLPAELSAAAVLINYWNKTVNNAVVVIGINMLGAGVYGEAEFISPRSKSSQLPASSFLELCSISEAAPTTIGNGQVLSTWFRYWKHPGPFVQYNNIAGAKGRFLGWWAVMTQAAFSYIGTEIVAIAAGEAKNPRRNLPKAIKRVYIRILLFYIGGVIIIGLLVPSNDSHLNLASGTAASSPFVIAIQRRPGGGWECAENILESFTQRPPIASLIFCSCFACLAYMGVQSGSNRVFIWFSNMVLLTSHRSFYPDLPFPNDFNCWVNDVVWHLCNLHPLSWGNESARLQPKRPSLRLSVTTVRCMFSGWAVFLKGQWDTATFVTNYLPFFLFPLLYAGAKYYYWRNGKGFAWSRLEDLDYVTNIAEIEADT
ncbi:amino acid permease-domain-containing protein [Mycena haematopus]|nr:amino acid permease-domain-containing protein [Mycena haematopus]